MEQQQQRQESLERRTSTTGMYQIQQIQSLPDCLLLLLLGFVRCYTRARLLKVVIATITF